MLLMHQQTSIIRKNMMKLICQRQHPTQYAFVTFRLDDICETMDFKKFNALRELFEKHGVKPLLGVIPNNRDVMLRVAPPCENFYESMCYLRDNGWMIAQHGFTHVYETDQCGLFSLNYFSEFAGLPYETQLNKIWDGQKILEKYGLQTDIFMAPGHTIDDNTIKALVSRGFHYVPDGRSTHPYVKDDLTFIPCRHSGPVLPKSGLITVCIHPNTVTEQQIRLLDHFLTMYKKNCISFSEAMRLPTISSSKAYWQEQTDLLYLKKIKPMIYPFYRMFKQVLKKVIREAY